MPGTQGLVTVAGCQFPVSDLEHGMATKFGPLKVTELSIYCCECKVLCVGSGTCPEC